MQNVILLREEFICFFILVYLFANHIICGLKTYHKGFTMMCIFAIGHVVFDAITVFTVNNMETVPNLLNHVCHILFYLSGTLFSVEFFCYVRRLSKPEREKTAATSKIIFRYALFSIAYFVVFYFIPINYTKGDGTYYSSGPAAAAAFVIPFIFFALTTIMLYLKRKKLDRRVPVALFPVLAVLFACELAEIIWTEILITGGCFTLVMIGVFFSLENPLLFQALKKAEESDRAKSYFLATMSHEIRTPLNAVIGFAELLKSEQLDEKTRQDYLNGISTSGKALLGIINDVLDLSKLEAGKMVITPVFTDFNVLTHELSAIFKQQRIAKGLQAFYDVDVPWLILVDKSRIRQILFNLMGNALKFTAEGSLTLRASFSEDTPENGTLTFSVIDTGIGIPEDEQTTLFQPFEQSKAIRGTHAANQGTGLGLAIILRMVQRMGGKIVLKSKPGKGSDFTVTLPGLKYKTLPVEPDKQPTESASPCQMSGIRILLVDDIPVNLKVLEAMCRRLGATQIVSVQSGNEAIKVLKNQKIDLIFTDMWMPDMNGAELAAEIRKCREWDRIRIVAVTADANTSNKFPGGQFNGVICKPIALAELKKFLAM